MNKEIKTIIQIIDLLHVYKGKVETIAIPGISMSIKKGEKVVIRGKSGVGKSTLLHCIAGVLKPTAGKILVDNRNIVGFNDDQLADYRRDTVGLVYQSYNLAPFLTVKENIEFPMTIAKLDSDVIERRTKTLVEQLEIERYLYQKPPFLSGGEQQRVAIAVALANKPLIVLADEPTGNLDIENSEIVYELLSQMCEVYNTTLIIASHDPSASKYTNREIILSSLKSKEL